MLDGKAEEEVENKEIEGNCYVRRTTMSSGTQPLKGGAHEEMPRPRDKVTKFEELK
jgi:hypothetical protein